MFKFTMEVKVFVKKLSQWSILSWLKRIHKKTNDSESLLQLY